MPLDEVFLSSLSKQIDQLKPLFPHIKTEIKIVEPADVNGFIQVKAPHYIAAFSEVKAGYLLNIGYMLQQLDLFFSSEMIGSCWQGWPKPTKELQSNQSMEFIITLAFGTAVEPLYRNSSKQFKRKSIIEITDSIKRTNLLEAVRLAPSPSQPWYFKDNEDSIDMFCSNNTGIISRISGSLEIMSKKLKEIEMGIAACHLKIAAEQHGFKTEFYKKQDAEIPAHPKYSYILSVILNQKP
jgi:hypothetical protein